MNPWSKKRVGTVDPLDAWSEIEHYKEHKDLIGKIYISSQEHIDILHNITIVLCDLYRRINELEREKGRGHRSSTS